MRIINSNNPAHGFADFVLVCDYCGREIGDEDANLEFYDQGEAFSCINTARMLSENRTKLDGFTG